MSANMTVRSQEEFAHVLRIGLSPTTDDPTMLVAFGFSRSFPNARHGYEATVWERRIDYGYRQTARGLRRVFACQRAFLKPATR